MEVQLYRDYISKVRVLIAKGICYVMKLLEYVRIYLQTT
jgi:hypothetical protein